MADAQIVLKSLCVLGLAAGLSGCGGDSSPISTRQGQETSLVNNGNPLPSDGKQSSSLRMKYNLNQFPMTKTVCDPFGGGQSSDPEMGVKATLHYRGAGQPRWYTAREYVEMGVASTQTLFFNDLYVPTRYFHQGFATQSSETVKDDSGQLLIEYFALKFETHLVLGPNDPEGDYELSSLADDGVIVKLQINGEWRTIINNDGDHSTRMGCTNQLVTMRRGQKIPMEIQYYQGPRFNIAHVLMWRLSHPSFAGTDAECGKQGNKYFFDPDNGGAPLAAYNRLLSRDWRPLQPANFMIAEGETFNPCVEAEAPLISDLRIEEVTPFDFTVAWRTDVPATSQILYSTAGGAQQITETDNVLRTEHRVQVSGLTPETAYQWQAVSTGANMGRTVSELSDVTTLRSEQ